ncbi:germination protein YpeB [Acetivibrio saccincola]|uniref:germination protein YpeB n=1 Tax=Acetivibrio saccincola TaxID=1677857 RepID=UPI000B0B0038|nr:germination protein YpeB [Acetivibrio saccincola]NLW27324.1 germination protein YpeB [Acetivibrio saccincola]HQD27810.1 germination protein YpeB [Acetivibrio saccincola]
MSIRGKLKDFKNRLSDRKMYTITIVALALVAAWGMYQYRNAANLRQELDNQYNRAFYEMVGYVDNVQALLIKSLITSTPNATATTMQEAWRQANLAQANLGQLPVSQHALANTAKFLAQVGDLAYSINHKNMEGKNLDEKEYKMIEQLHGYAESLNKSLNDLQSQISSGRIKWGELREKGTPLFKRTSSEMPKEQFENIDKTFVDYPTLIYDGPFSDHLTKIEPKGLTGEDLNQDEAKEYVIKFFGKDKVERVDTVGKNDNSDIKTYTYNVVFKDGSEDDIATVDVTQKGGHVLWMLRNRDTGQETVDIDKAKELGKKFLEERGYKGMVDTYYLKEDGTATINYAYQQEGVTIYPDLIKVKIALDNGEIVGFESKGYLYAHTERNIPEPKITEEEARSMIGDRMEIVSSGLAIIPTDYKTELFTYEFKGKLNDRDFIVYINAETGKEEKILMIVDTPNGILTM